MQLYVGESDQIGGGIEYNGDNSPGTTGAGSDIFNYGSYGFCISRLLDSLRNHLLEVSYCGFGFTKTSTEFSTE